MVSGVASVCSRVAIVTPSPKTSPSCCTRSPNRLLKNPRSPFDTLRANGAGMAIVGDLPFVLSLSKHENDFFSTLLARLSRLRSRRGWRLRLALRPLRPFEHLLEIADAALELLGDRARLFAVTDNVRGNEDNQFGAVKPFTIETEQTAEHRDVHQV